MAVDREFLDERDQRIIQMKLQGLSVPEIAKRFGVTAAVVKNAIDRQYMKFARYNELPLMAAITQELERLDLQFKAIFPMTQFRNVTVDGTTVTIEPNEKFVNLALAIHDRRVRLLGLDKAKGLQSLEEAPMRAALAGSEKLLDEGPRGNPEATGRKMLALMAESGILSDEVVSVALGNDEPVEEVESIEIQPKELTA